MNSKGHKGLIRAGDFMNINADLINYKGQWKLQDNVSLSQIFVLPSIVTALFIKRDTISYSTISILMLNVIFALHNK